MKTVSLKDIADRTGVSRMTVSCALRNSPRVRKETAERIRAVAKQLGYAPDPKLAAAMTGVRNAKRKTLEPIAWLNANQNARAYHDYTWLAPYRLGAAERCAELGYKLDEFWMRDPGMTDRRMSSILVARGIRGVVLCPAVLPEITHLRLDWKHFASVSFETAVLIPRVHRVAPDYHYNILLALKMLRRLGYRRIGLFLHRQEERRSHHTYLASFRYFQSGIPAAEHVTPLVYDPFDKAALFKWLDEVGPDVVLGHHSKLVAWMEESGRRVPEDIGVAHLSLDGDCEDWAGIWQHKHRIGAQTVELLVSMIQNSRFGLPDIAYETNIPGEWRHGKTLRRRDVIITKLKRKTARARAR
ncbi:LacI family transcriptional regulator [Termitidicoccus mucosus]|uniref:LacI family transcriptional regulator n=1 Tax=Termitidicoccus mucosus TaxID=1184151 RepID=A0A178IB52_9BACT|nr:LacI family transcriptional regulator [Opitutaceae bacterium TSB47]